MGLIIGNPRPFYWHEYGNIVSVGHMQLDSEKSCAVPREGCFRMRKNCYQDVYDD